MDNKNGVSSNKVVFDTLGFWNVYFIVKFALFNFNYIEFHVVENAAFLAFLLLPVGAVLNKLKHAIGVIIALLLLHHDSYLPPLSRLFSSTELLSNFSLVYLVELLGRMISWQVVALVFIAIVVYLYFVNWVRFTSVSVIGICYIAFFGGAGLLETQHDNGVQINSNQNIATVNAKPETNEPKTTLTGKLTQFYTQQATLQTAFPDSFEGDDFDVLILNICSLGWHDLEHVGRANHRFLMQSDIVFKNFNSATSYSGPAAIRLLKASCGQTAHTQLYDDAPAQCYLFNNLANLGFNTQFAMNHDGHFDNFLNQISEEGSLAAPLQSFANIAVTQKAFDDTPIYSDAQVLQRWLDNRVTSGSARSALYYNSISLHDGNIVVGQRRGLSSVDSYGPRTDTLFQDLELFMRKLEQSGKNYIVVMVPEHGASLSGDKMQIAGMREIPSPNIVNVPVAVRFVSNKLNKNNVQTKIINKNTSYLAISQLIANTIEQNPFTQGYLDIDLLTSDLPVTNFVAENESTEMQISNGLPYIRLDKEEWIKYPTN